ncbi:MAG: transcriptional regulator [Frankiales bacterium]|nr:transcriptional regulator [Frankiales bacterium]
MPPAPAVSGRPRDPRLAARAADAAVALFGEQGWAGFSMEAVARRAGVGKASLYLRWRSREDLLSDALESRVGLAAMVDTGVTRDDLVLLARALLELYTGDAGAAARRISVEAPTVPALQQRHQQLFAAQSRAARAIVLRGVARGDLPPGTSASLLLETLCGGAILHASTTTSTSEQLDAYAERLVDFLLVATRHSAYGGS